MQVGDTVSHYKILEILGGGGMGVVYKAEDTKLKRHVALKFLPSELTRDPEAKQRFVHEAQAASALEHTNICNIHEIGETEDDQLFIVMACYEGETLKKKVERGLLKLEETTDIALQVAAGLTAAHDAGITHRDIKPANIMITNRGDVKIVDFGLAKLAGQTRLTRIDTTIGTTAYMSPEQASGADVDQRTDIWSLGVVIYEMLTGRHPFRGDYENAVVYAIKNERPEPVTSLRTGVPLALERIVDKCLAKQPSERYQHADELLVDLQRLRTAATEDYLPEKQIRLRDIRAKSFRPYLLVICIATFITAGYLFLTKKEQPQRTLSIVVLDVRNHTEEKELDGLSELFIRALEISRRFDVLPRYRLFDILKQLGESEVSRIDAALGKQICRSAQADVMVKASIRKLGDLYSVGLEAIDPATDKILFADQTETREQAGLFNRIDHLADEMRKGLRETEDEIATFSQNVAVVLTDNYEALQHFYNGENLRNREKESEAERAYRQAIELDSTFGLAYYRQARIVIGEQLRSQFLRKAESLQHRLPEKERYLLRAYKVGFERGWPMGLTALTEVASIYANDKEVLYYLGRWSNIAGRFEEAVAHLEGVLALDPSYEPAYRSLFRAYRGLRQDEKAFEVARRYASLNPVQAKYLVAQHYLDEKQYETAIELYEEMLSMDVTSDAALRGMMAAYGDLGDNDKMLDIIAKLVLRERGDTWFQRIGRALANSDNTESGLQMMEKAYRRFPERKIIPCEMANLYMYQDAYDKAEALVQPLVEKFQTRQTRRWAYNRLYQIYLYQGRYRAALGILDEILQLYADIPVHSARWTIRKGCIQLWGWGERDKVFELTKPSVAAQHSFNHYNYWTQLFRFYILLGDFVSAEHIASEKFPVDRSIHYLAIVRIAQNKCSDLNALDEALIGSGAVKTFALYFLSKCLLDAGRLNEAIEYLYDVQSYYHNWWALRAVMYPRSFYLLGRIYEEKGDEVSAIKNYQRFVELWKNADEDLIALVDTKERLVKLKERLTP